MQVPQSEQNATRRILPFIRIAAAIFLLAAIGTIAVLINDRQSEDTITVASTADERNIRLDLPDGSRVWLNRNSEISWPREFENGLRAVTLRGEAFFEITPDASNPFIINAGKGSVKVLGTSFNVITSNLHNEIEVLVETGKVLLSDNAGTDLVLLPGVVGRLGEGRSSSSVNENANYTSWKTDLLVYEGQKLDVVFRDLKRVHDIEIIADDPLLLNESLHGVFDKLPQDTIIQIICTTFNLNYKKEGGIYHLSR
jgi:ferric-dicitrate binding protein FerR (iron transport regulator)